MNSRYNDLFIFLFKNIFLNENAFKFKMEKIQCMIYLIGPLKICLKRLKTQPRNLPNHSRAQCYKTFFQSVGQ
jgi:hypothetical protein